MRAVLGRCCLPPCAARGVEPAVPVLPTVEERRCRTYTWGGGGASSPLFYQLCVAHGARCPEDSSTVWRTALLDILVSRTDCLEDATPETTMHYKAGLGLHPVPHGRPRFRRPLQARGTLRPCLARLVACALATRCVAPSWSEGLNWEQRLAQGHLGGSTRKPIAIAQRPGIPAPLERIAAMAAVFFHAQVPGAVDGERSP